MINKLFIIKILLYGHVISGQQIKSKLPMAIKISEAEQKKWKQFLPLLAISHEDCSC